MILNYNITNWNGNKSLYKVSMKRNKDNKNEICFYSGKTFIFSFDKREVLSDSPDEKRLSSFSEIEGYLMSILLSKVNRVRMDMKSIFTHDLSDVLPSEIVNYNENFLK